MQYDRNMISGDADICHVFCPLQREDSREKLQGGCVQDTNLLSTPVLDECPRQHPTLTYSNIKINQEAL